MTPRTWMSRRQAAEYLCCSVSSVDRHLVAMSDNPQRGKFRFMRLKDWGSEREPIKIVAADVYAMLPIPDAVNEEEVA